MKLTPVSEHLAARPRTARTEVHLWEERAGEREKDGRRGGSRFRHCAAQWNGGQGAHHAGQHRQQPAHAQGTLATPYLLFYYLPFYWQRQNGAGAVIYEVAGRSRQMRIHRLSTGGAPEGDAY
jgi:hypothetical protein